MSSLDLSILVPVYKDEDALEAFSLTLKTQRNIHVEVIIIEGKQRPEDEDPTYISGVREISEKNEFQYISSALGRGLQMNAGREIARASLFLFLHADSEFSSPLQLSNAIQSLLADPISNAGHFSIRFRSGVKIRGLEFLELKSKTNRPYTINGDQGLMISAAFFDAIGGFSTKYTFLEDQEIVEKIRRKGDLLLFEDPLITSARRFEQEGFLRRYFLMMVIMGAYRTQSFEFFDISPQLYPDQQSTELLDLTPFFDAISEFQKAIGFKASVNRWIELGIFARENIWQLFLFGDFVFSNDNTKLLQIYDDYIQEKLNTSILDLSLAFVLAAGITRGAPLFFDVVDKVDRLEGVINFLKRR